MPPAEPRVRVEQVDPREPLKQHLEHDPAFEARERSPEAMVVPPERQVGTLAALDIEAVQILEGRRVPIRRPWGRDDIVALSQRNPFTSQSASTRRKCVCTGESKRGTSSTAAGIRPGSSLNRWSWSGLRRSASIPLPIRLVVVSWPAIATRRSRFRVSLSLSHPPSSSRPGTSALTKSSLGAAERCSTIGRNQRANALPAASPRARLRVVMVGFSISARRADQTLNRSQSSAGTPSISAINMIGRGRATG